MLRSVTTCSLPGSLLSKLKDNGFLYLQDVCGDNELNSEGKSILKQCGFDSLVSFTKLPLTRSALDVWQEECMTPHILTFSKALDDMLNGGIIVGEVTELCGAPGSGKTQLSLQLCVDVQIPESCGGLGAEAVFIETDSGFTPKRLREIAKACVEHCQLIASRQVKDEKVNEVQRFTEAAIMQGVQYFSACGYSNLLAAVYSIRDVLQKNKKVKLIVVDSLAFPFRDGVLNSLVRTRLLCSLLEELRTVAVQYNLAVVITNQLTTKIGPKNERNLVPALGESFGHYCNQRIMLGHLHSNCYAALLLKSVTQPQLSAQFQILKSGIRDYTRGEDLETNLC